MCNREEYLFIVSCLIPCIQLLLWFWYPAQCKDESHVCNDNTKLWWIIITDKLNVHIVEQYAGVTTVLTRIIEFLNCRVNTND